ncbi:hypothetical protein T484DRAFT_1778728, partial [Baffinella frigidus]
MALAAQELLKLARSAALAGGAQDLYPGLPSAFRTSDTHTSIQELLKLTRSTALAGGELLKLARSAALAGGAQDRLARQAGVSLEAILHRQEVQDTLASSPEKWAWLCEWLSRPADAPSSEQRRSPVGGVHAASNAPPSGGEGGKLAGLLHRCAPAATLPPRVESDAPRVVVENAGTAAANGTYIFAGDLPGHGPMFSRVDGPRTW